MNNNLKFDLVVFDLDGTLASSHKTIYEATLGTLKTLGINHHLDPEKFYGMIGWHFEDIFEQFDFKVPDFEEFLKIYKSVYFDYIESSKLYPNVVSVLKSITSARYKTALLTTKSQEQAELLSKYFEIDSFLNYIMGRRPGMAHKPSPEPLLKICEELDVDPELTLMVGDTEMDILCGINAGAPTCAVTFGYRSKDQLLELNPDYVVDSFKDIYNILSK